MSDGALPIPVQDIAEACGVSHGKILLALRRRDLHESAVAGNGREASITSRSACRTILRDLLETEEYEDAADTLMGNASVPSDEGQSGEEHYEEADLLTPKKISIVGRGRERDRAVAQADRGYAFLKSEDLDEDCHLWISDLSERAKNYLDVSEGTVGCLPAVVPQVQFRPQDSPEGMTVETIGDAAPRWSSALISVQDDGGAEIPNHSGLVRLWTDEDLDPGPYVARVWPAIPTDVEGAAADAVIATPEERFRWDGSPVDNLDAIEEDPEPVESLLEGTADRIVSYIDGEEDEAFDPSVLAGIFEMLSGRGEALGRRVHQIVVDRLRERPSTVSPEAVQGLVEAAPEENEERLDRCARMFVEGVTARLEDDLQSISLDLETDGHEIWEIGMAATRDAARTYGRSSIMEGLDAIRSSKPDTWIGHNFRNWDRDVLAAKNIEITDEHIWDTLEVEALLSPHKESLALETSHEAGEDAQVAYRLFCTQLIRVLLRLHGDTPCSASELLGPIAEAQVVENIRAVLSEVEAVHNRIKSLCETRRDDLLSSTAEPEVVRKIEDCLGDFPVGETVHLLYPRPLEPLMERLPEVRFAGRADGPYQQQVRSPSDVGDNGNPFLRRFATLYRHDCSTRNRDPVVGRLSPWVQSRLRQSPEWIGPREEGGFSSGDEEVRSAQAIPVERYQETDLETPDQIVAVAPDLIEAYSSNVVSKYAPDELTDFVSRNHLWAQFDGAGSYCELTEDHVTELGFDDVAARHESKNWLQRTPQGEYVLHEHQPRVLNTIRGAVPDSCGWREVRLDDEEGRPVSCVAVDEKANTSPLQQRLNPNTSQRAWYWTVQGLLLREVAKEEDRPIVLLTQDERKVDALTSFFQQREWYVPAEGTLRRRLERLEVSRESQRLLVVPLQRWTKLVTQEVSPEVQLVVESLPIKEQQAMRGDEVHPDDLQNLPGQAESRTRENETHRPEADSEEEDTVETPEGDSPQNRPFAIQRGLYLIAPLLKWLSHSASTLSEDGRLWVLDPRVEPIDLPHEIELETHRVSAYSDPAFESCLEEAEQHFASPVQQGDLTLPDDWKETLEHVFLPEKEDGSRGEFYDDQEVCLEPIIQRESDILVELPTGSGKSVLFQAPGLYHGIRHGLLTIVVTPLKALMVDQAYSLYEKGFLSSVDYVNGDLPYIEIQDIYRRLASGEISLIYVAPERFRSRSFVRAVRSRLRADGRLCYFVFDEAHTVSLWGLDFRPDFLRAVEFVNEQRKDPDVGSFPCIMLSATITEQIHEHLNNVVYDYEAQSSR